MVNLALNQGIRISETEAKTFKTYTDSGFKTHVWKEVADSFPIFTGLNFDYLTPPLQANSTITKTESMSKTTYFNSNWDMERIWSIVERTTTPRLVARFPDVDLGAGLTHQMRYQRVIPSLEGTMNYMGITWKSLGSFYRFPDPPAPGTDGQVVEYEVGNLEHTIFAPEQNKNIFVKFFASGVRDVAGAGGFSGYNDELRRSVTVSQDASAQVNFYFAEPKYLPSLNYKISISTPDGVVDIIGKEESSGYPIRMQYNGVVLGLPTVPTTDLLATNVRVVTDEGIVAFQEYSEFSFRDDIY